jgi:hypothetical protein
MRGLKVCVTSALLFVKQYKCTADRWAMWLGWMARRRNLQETLWPIQGRRRNCCRSGYTGYSKSSSSLSSVCISMLQVWISSFKLLIYECVAISQRVVAMARLCFTTESQCGRRYQPLRWILWLLWPQSLWYLPYMKSHMYSAIPILFIGNCAGDTLQQRKTIRILLFKIPAQTGRHSPHLQSITDAHAMFSSNASRQIAWKREDLLHQQQPEELIPCSGLWKGYPLTP